MNDIHITGTQSTPAIDGDWEHGILTMVGDSYPENSFEFFEGVIRWIEAFLADDQRPLRLDLHLVYINTSSVKAMLDIFEMLEEAHRGGRQVAVEWRYDPDNDRVFDLADEFREDCTFPFAIEPEGRA